MGFFSSIPLLKLNTQLTKFIRGGGKMKRKEFLEIQREHELLMTEIMLLKDEIKLLKRQLDVKEPRPVERRIRVEIERPYDDGWCV
jgi:hypothetical protein